MLNGPWRLSSSFPHCLEQRLNGTEYPKGKTPNGLWEPWVEYSLAGVTLYARMKGILWKYLLYSNWHIQLMKISLSLSCQADWILMLFWISTNLIQLLRSDAKLRLFSYKLYATKYFYLKKKSCFYKEPLNQSVSTEDLSYQRAVGTAALATLAPTLRNSFPAEQSGPHSGCSGLSKSQLPVNALGSHGELGADHFMQVNSYRHPLYFYWQLV